MPRTNRFCRRTNSTSTTAQNIAACLPDSRHSPEMGAQLKQQLQAVWTAAATSMKEGTVKVPELPEELSNENQF